MKFGRAVFEICEQRDRQTNKQTDRLTDRYTDRYGDCNTLNPYQGQSNKNLILPVLRNVFSSAAREVFFCPPPP